MSTPTSTLKGGDFHSVCQYAVQNEIHMEVVMSQNKQWQQWQLEGNIPEAYEKYLVPTIFAPWGEALVKLAELKPGERVLDVACGTGIVARLAAQQVGATGKVVGLDLSPDMLDVARSAAADEGLSIEWREGSVLEMPFPDGAFDAVLCQQGLQYFDNENATQEMQRVLAPGGRLVANVWRPIQYNPGFSVLAQALERHVSGEVAAIMHAPFSFGDAEKLQALIDAAGFAETQIRLQSDKVRFPSPEEYVRRQVISSPLSGPFGQVNEKARARLTSDFGTAMKAYLDDDGLVFPMEAHTALAYK